MGDAPFACRLDALDPEQRKRHAALLRELEGAVSSVDDLPDGVSIRFPMRPYLFLRLAEWMELERACCPFFQFGLIFENRVPAMRLDLRGPEGVKDFLRGEFPVLSTLMAHS
ncbi:MAG TPA: hypothetical protein VGQ75_05900 [Thermoanaerobaculia bacterium]|nr:hypothetical protein [Thermoanaerobaculia bacterium]